jgi:flagella basal body P-ring formation protein FlgA
MNGAAFLLLALTSTATTTTASSSSVPSSHQQLEALLRSQWPASTRIVVRRVAGLPEGCVPFTVQPLSPLDHSGPVVADVDDQQGSCRSRVVIDVQIEKPVLVLTRSLAVNEPLSDAVSPTWREVPRHQQTVTTLPEGAISRRPLMAGQTLVEDDLAMPGPAVGSPVKIVLHAGELRLMRSAVVTPCAGGVDRRHHCARLPNGRQVHGVFRDGVIALSENP